MVENKQIASTILSQLGGSKISAFIGAKHFIAIENGLQINFKAKSKNKSNVVRIILTPDDLYKVEFAYSRGMNYYVRSEFDGIYCGQLIELFEKETGLFLHF